MKKAIFAGLATVALLIAAVAPAAAYVQKTSYPSDGAPSLDLKDGICQGYGSSDDVGAETGMLGGVGSMCDYVQVRINYRNGKWVGYTNWKRKPTYASIWLGLNNVINFGQHGVDNWH